MSVGNVEIIGPRRITDLGDGRYMSNPTQPGIIGSGIIDEAAVQALREKYSGGSDYHGVRTFTPGQEDLHKRLEEARRIYRELQEAKNPASDNESVMGESEFNKKMLLYSLGGVLPMVYGLQDEEFQKAREYYSNNTDTKTGKVIDVLKKALGLGAAAVGGFLVAKNLPALKTFAGNVVSKIAGLFR